MLFENLSPDFLRQHFPKNLILKLEGVKLDAFSQKYSPGQVLQGKVVEAVPKGRAIVNFGGEKILVQPGKPVTPGQTLTAKIEQILPTPILKLVDPVPGSQDHVPSATVGKNSSKSNAPSKPENSSTPTPVHNEPDFVTRFSRNNLAKNNFAESLSPSDLSRLQLVKGQEARGEVLQVIDNKTLLARINQNEVKVHTTDGGHFKPGDPVVARVLSQGKGYYLYAEPAAQGSRPVVPAMIRPYLSNYQTLTNTIASVENKVLGHPVLKEIKTDPALMERLRETVQTLQPRDPGQLDGAKIKEIMDRSGIHYEAKVKNLNFENLSAERRLELGRDFKGQLLEFSKTLESELSKANLPETLIKPTGELLTQVRQAIQNIEFQQLSHQYSKQENHPLLLQIPNSFFGEGETVRIYFRDGADNSKGNQNNKSKDLNLVFLLDLSALGNLRIDSRVNDNGISVNIFSESPEIIEFINQRAPELKARMEELGFQITVTGLVQKQVEMDVPDIMSNLLVDRSLNLVDIKT